MREKNISMMWIKDAILVEKKLVQGNITWTKLSVATCMT